MHAFRKVDEYRGDKGYSQSFANWSYDINGDGWDDIVVVGFPGAPFHWYENPKGSYDVLWKEHVIWHSACNESPDFLDLTGDGKPEAILGSQPEAIMGFLQIPSGSKVIEKWNFQAVSRAGNPRTNGTTATVGVQGPTKGEIRDIDPVYQRFAVYFLNFRASHVFSLPLAAIAHLY